MTTFTRLVRLVERAGDGPWRDRIYEILGWLETQPFDFDVVCMYYPPGENLAIRLLAIVAGELEVSSAFFRASGDPAELSSESFYTTKPLIQLTMYTSDRTNPFYSPQVRMTLVHELTHYFDHLRRTAPMPAYSPRSEEYWNTDHETNAFYHGVMSSIENDVQLGYVINTPEELATEFELRFLSRYRSQMSYDNLEKLKRRAAGEFERVRALARS